MWSGYVDVAQGRPPHPRRAPRPQALATRLQDDVKRLQEQLALERWGGQGCSAQGDAAESRVPALCAAPPVGGRDGRARLQYSLGRGGGRGGGAV
jgi:hypothetical protein